MGERLGAEHYGEERSETAEVTAEQITRAGQASVPDWPYTNADFSPQKGSHSSRDSLPNGCSQFSSEGRKERRNQSVKAHSFRSE
jgi:hypothetical protein